MKAVLETYLQTNALISEKKWGLLTTERTDMGLYPNGSVLLDPLGIGVILPSFQALGN